MANTALANLFLFFIGKKRTNVDARPGAQIRKYLFVVQILMEQPDEASSWKYLRIFYVARPNDPMCVGFCFKMPC